VTYGYGITYNASAQTISVRATTGGTTTTLFNAIFDGSFTRGQVGFGEGYNTPNVDNVILSAQSLTVQAGS
jgi:hypothetical protein